MEKKNCQVLIQGVAFPYPLSSRKKERKKKKNFGAVTALVIVNWMTSSRELMQRRDNKQNLILKYKELYHMCTVLVFSQGTLTCTDHYTDLTQPYIYRIQLSTQPVYAPRKGPYIEFFIQCNGPAVLTAPSLGQCSKASI